jgi:prophage regulatory protein
MAANDRANMHTAPDQTAALPQQDRILRRAELEAKLGIKHTAIYEAIRNAGFPEPIQLTAKAVGWIESEVNDWIASRPRAPRENPYTQKASAAKRRYRELAAA